MIPIRIGTMAAQGAFIGAPLVLKVNTAITGSGTVSSTNQFKLPVLGYYTVSWGDGNAETVIALDSSQFITHTYASSGVKTIKIYWTSRSLIGVYFNNTGDRNKITDIESWGGAPYTSLEGAFRGCSNLNPTFTDAPKLTNVTSLAYMFDGVSNFNSNISSWNISSVSNLKYMFRNASAFNQPIGSWNFSNVVDASHMFDGATAFNQSLSSWDTSSLIYLSGMFFGATAFNQDLSSWDLSAATDTSEMFRAASAFNQNISSWNVANVTNMSGMFRSATAFNQSIGAWDTGAVSDMSSMFREAAVFNQSIASWDTAAVTNMSLMFNYAAAFNQNIAGWDTGAVTDMSGMFREAVAFNQAIGSWDVSKVTDVSNMFNNANGFDQDIGTWQVGTVTNFVSFMSNKEFTNFTATNLNSIYNGWTNYELQPSKSISFGTIKYTAAATESRALLTRTNTSTSITAVANNGSGLIRVTAATHGLTTGNKVFIKNVAGTTEANGAWTVTVVDINNVDLQSSTFTNAYTSGGSLRTGYGWSVSDGGI